MGSDNVSHPFHENVSRPFRARNDTGETSRGETSVYRADREGVRYVTGMCERTGMCEIYLL